MMVKCLEKVDDPKRSSWKSPVKKDEHDYPICDIKQKIETPQLLLAGRHGITFSVPKMSHIWGKY